MPKFSSFAAAVLAAVVVAEAVPVGPDSVRSSKGLKAELRLSQDKSKVHARLARCQEVRDLPEQCEDATHWDLPGLKVDSAARAVLHDGAVVARWSRFGSFVRLQKPFRLDHEVADGRAKLRVVRAAD